MTIDSEPRPLELLAREVRLTFFALKAAAEQLHADQDGLTAGHRGVLESVVTHGPQTVPVLARARPVSRQHIQGLVNRLRALELVQLQPNPASRRSPLVAATPRGRQRFFDMLGRERTALPDSKIPIPEARLREAAETLSRLRVALGEVREG
jgi:DNA-binding MarR family transcriptional regulator